VHGDVIAQQCEYNQDVVGSDPKRIVLAGGGTGGHVYPLLAIVESLGSSYDFHFVGSERSEKRIVPQYAQEYSAGLEFHQIDIRFSYRLPTPRNWGYYRRNIFPLLRGRPFRQAREILDRLRPDLVLASGGYVSAPTLWAARELGIPYALLQLDAAVGLVNRYFAVGATRVYASTERGARSLTPDCPGCRVIVSGFPARRPRQGRDDVMAQYGFDPHRKLFTIMGGSLGTGAIAGLAADLINLLDQSAYADGLTALFSAGERMDTAQAIRDKGTQRLQFAAVDYIGDSVSVLAASDFYLGRSGASTVAELIATGTQSLLIPDPQHRDRQQYLNAEELVRRGQGEILEQSDATGAKAMGWLSQAWERAKATPPNPPGAEVIARDLQLLLD
jgi:UDP-N-acetylglucosamine--N-acetylmuramyl-(pentapeptide) pyrophosphoryl-undecaprenol N-acetylglucosamine transferase